MRDTCSTLLSSSWVLGALLVSPIAQAAGRDVNSTPGDTGGPLGQRHNFWWWLALGVSGALIILLLILLFLSWCYCARHSHRGHHSQQRKEKHHSGDGNPGCAGPADDALSTSPDNVTTRQGSHDTQNIEGQYIHGEATVTVSNYRNAARDVSQFYYNAEKADRGGDNEYRSRSSQKGRRTIFLAGGGRREKSKSRRGSQTRKRSPPPRLSVTSATGVPVATWSNKPRTTTMTTTPVVVSSRMPVLEHLPAVGKEVTSKGVLPNPFNPSSVQHVEADIKALAIPDVAATTTTTTTQTVNAGKPWLTQSSSTPQPSRSPEREVVDAPASIVENGSLHHTSLFPQHEEEQHLQQRGEKPNQQLQVAKSSVRFSIKAHKIAAAEAAPPEALSRGSSKQYFFGYQHKPIPTKPSNVRALPTTAPLCESSDQQPPVDALAERQRSSTPHQQQQEQQMLSDSILQQRQTSPQQGCRALAEFTVLSELNSCERSPTPPLLVPGNPLAHQHNNNSNTNGAQPSSSSPCISHVFSPLRLTGMEGEAATVSTAADGLRPSTTNNKGSGERVPEAAGAIAIAPLDRPPRHELPSPTPRVPLTEQQTPAPTKAAVTSVPAGAAHRHQLRYHYSSTGSSFGKKRIELFRKGTHKKSGPTPSRRKGRSGSAPAVHDRPPLLATTAQASSIAAATPSCANRHALSTVTKGVPQLFFGKRDASPSREPPAPARAASAHQRPPRPGSAAASSSAAPHSRAKGGSSRQVPTMMHLSAVQLTQASPSALLPSNDGGSLSASVAAAAALVGGGAQSVSSQRNSLSHYGSVTSMNGGNSPLRTSLGRVRSSSKVRFIDQDWRSAEDTKGSSGTATAAKASTTAAALAPLGSANAHGSGSVLREHALAVPQPMTVKKETLPELPPVPATVQVVIEQGRRTATAQLPPQQQQIPLPGTNAYQEQQANAGSARTSRVTATAPFSSTIASVLETPQVQQLRNVPAVMTLPSVVVGQQQRQQQHRFASPLETRTSPSRQRQVSPVAQSRANSGVQPDVARVCEKACTAARQVSGDDLESFSSEASTMPAGMLPLRQQGRQVTESLTPPHFFLEQQPQQLQSPPLQPLFSTISPYSSVRRITPTTAASGVEVSYPRHPSGIEVLRITQASGDVQLMPPPASSSSRLHPEDDDAQVTTGTSRFASGQLAGRNVRDSAVNRSQQRGLVSEEDYVAGAGVGFGNASTGCGETKAESHPGFDVQYAGNPANRHVGSSTSHGRRVN